MSVGKVILVVLATLVIFSTGLITGVVLTKQMANAPAAAVKPSLPGPGAGMTQFMRRIQSDLDLTSEQNSRIEEVLRQSQERTRGMVRGEFGQVRDQIRAELKPAQREKFEQLLRERQRRMQELRENHPWPRPNPFSSTNQGSSR